MKNKLFFTLLELLITIAIIAILASMLLPTLSKVKEKGLAIDCTSNLKQLSLSNLLYADDNKDFLVPYSVDHMGGDKPRWHGTSEDSSWSGSADYDPSKGPLTQYLGTSGKANACRGVKFPKATSAFEKGCGGYGYNTLLGKLSEGWDDTAYSSGYKLSRIKTHSDKVMFADSAIPIGSSGGFDAAGTQLGPSSSVEPPGGSWIIRAHYFEQEVLSN